MNGCLNNAKEPSLETLMMLGSIAPKSEEEGKPTFKIELTTNEMQALAILSNARFQQLMHVPGEDPIRICGIYLGITSKLTLGLLQAGFAPKEKSDKDGESKEGGVDL